MPNFTKQAIKASFMKLLNEQPLSKISVRSIVEDCGINRNSFYYHYQDITDLIEEIIKEEADALIIKYPCISSLKECVDVAFKFALENKRRLCTFIIRPTAIYTSVRQWSFANMSSHGILIPFLPTNR